MVPEELDETALELCHEIGAKSAPAVRATKEIVNLVWCGAVAATTMQAELYAQASLFSVRHPPEKSLDGSPARGA